MKTFEFHVQNLLTSEEKITHSFINDTVRVCLLLRNAGILTYVVYKVTKNTKHLI